MFDHLDSDRGIHLVGQLDLREVDHKLDLGISISKTHRRREKKAVFNIFRVWSEGGSFTKGLSRFFFFPRSSVFYFCPIYTVLL